MKPDPRIGAMVVALYEYDINDDLNTQAERARVSLDALVQAGYSVELLEQVGYMSKSSWFGLTDEPKGEWQTPVYRKVSDGDD